ncbi:molybdopterin-dependent oxidoreductase, partial [candidate division KSB1 bacterium]|nr:molybdopterin-dependent oxidoreductase [candidate division KSB1 bacterium]
MTSDPKNYRIDAQEKINGSAQYTDDLRIPDLWHALTIRSTYPRADILDIHFNPEFNWDAVVVATAADIPNNYVSMLEDDMPFLAEKRVNYIGEPIVLIAAPDKALLDKAAENIEIDYKPLPYVDDMMASEGSDILLYGTNNVFKEIHIENGDLNRVKREKLNKIEIEARTGFQEHVYLEPQAIIAIPVDDRIEIHGSMQCPYYIKRALDVMFDGKKHITVIHETTGGAFGGKEDYPSLLAGHVAILAVKSGHPVSLVLDRTEDVQFSTKRHPSYQRLVAYVNDAGVIMGLEVDILLDGGAYCTLSPVVLARAALTSTNSYYIPNVRIDA